ncbi:MAG: class II fructose-bisphosphate aldolase [Candidatus Binataceae bacterium]
MPTTRIRWPKRSKRRRRVSMKSSSTVLRCRSTKTSRKPGARSRHSSRSTRGSVVEGEIGYIGSASAILEQKPEGMSALSTPEEARQFVEATKVDVLAPAVGNMHGMLESMVRGDAKKRLDLGLIAQLAKATGALMTLHGGSGTNDNDFRTAIKNGISIVHVNTEIRIAWRRGVEAAFKTHPKEVAPYKILPAGVGAIKEIVTARLKLFNFM